MELVVAGVLRMRVVVSWLVVLLVAAEQEEQGKVQGRGRGKELERFTRKGKLVTQEAGGDIHVELRRKRWEGPHLPLPQVG